MRTCVDCGVSIDDRIHSGRGGQSAYLCLGCARIRKLKYQRELGRRIYRDPVLSEKRRAYVAAWRRQKTARRVLEVVRCEGCGETFQMNRIGRRRLACITCTAFHEGYVSITRFLATARRRAVRQRERRQRRAA